LRASPCIPHRASGANRRDPRFIAIVPVLAIASLFAMGLGLFLSHPQRVSTNRDVGAGPRPSRLAVLVLAYAGRVPRSPLKRWPAVESGRIPVLEPRCSRGARDAGRSSSTIAFPDRLSLAYPLALANSVLGVPCPAPPSSVWPTSWSTRTLRPRVAFAVRNPGRANDRESAGVTGQQPRLDAATPRSAPPVDSNSRSQPARGRRRIAPRRAAAGEPAPITSSICPPGNPLDVAG
jgi:hypothetical protein